MIDPAATAHGPPMIDDDLLPEDFATEDRHAPADKLVRMANRIAAFFAGQPDREAALAGFIRHLALYWAPLLRAALADRLLLPDAGGLNDFAVEALRRPAVPTSPA